MPLSGSLSPKHRLALPAGFQLEEYRLLKVLGQGGFGITYLAEDARMTHEVAIKELLPGDFATRSEDFTVVALTQSDEADLAWAKQRFIDEARIVVRLNHPNIVRFFRYFESNNTAYLVMEFVRGQNFRDWMQTHRKPNEQELKAVLLPLLDGLEYVHQQNLLHRDISPENVMITEAGRPMLLDFGSARAALGTNPKTEVVRPGFSPIEQYQRNSAQGSYTDLYALAGIMIQAISGEAPPQSIDRFGVRDPYQPVTHRLRGKYSERFLRSLDTAFAALPKDRPQSVERWREMLEKPVKQRSPRRNLVVGFGAAFLLACAAGWLIWHPSKPSAFQDGKREFEQHDFAPAIHDLVRATQEDPRDALAFYYLGLAYANQQKYDLAVKAYDQALKIDQNLAGAKEAKAAAESKIKSAKPLVFPSPRFGLETLHPRLLWTTPTPTPTPTPAPTPAGSPVSAQALIQRAAAEVYFERATQSDFSKMDYQKAIDDLNEAIRLDPYYADAYNERGHAYILIKKYNEAFADFDRAVSLNPADEVYIFNRGIANADLSKYDQAISDYTKAMTLKPDDAQAYYGRGLVYSELKKYSDAIEDYNEAIRLDPKFPKSYEKRGDAQSALGFTLQATLDYAKAKELQKK